ncbi:unnamed protein product, partial [Ascophyllum nodosum]
LETESSALLRRRRPPRRWEGVEPAVWLVNRGKATPPPLLSAIGRIFGGEGRRRRSARSPGPQRRHWGHHPSPLSPVAPSTGGDTSGLQSQSEERRKSDRLDITAQQDNPRSKSRRHTVTPAVTRSAARAQLG